MVRERSTSPNHLRRAGTLRGRAGLTQDLEEDRRRRQRGAYPAHRAGQEDRPAHVPFAIGGDHRDRDRGVSGARPGADRQPHLGAAQFAGASRVTKQVVGRLTLVCFGIAIRPVRVVSDRGAVGRRGRRLGRDRLAEPRPRRVVEQRPEAPAGPDLDDGQRPAEFAEPCPDRVAPARLAGRPDEAPT